MLQFCFSKLVKALLCQFVFLKFIKLKFELLLNIVIENL